MRTICERRHRNGETYRIDEHPSGVFSCARTGSSEGPSDLGPFSGLDLATAAADEQAGKSHSCRDLECPGWVYPAAT